MNITGKLLAGAAGLLCCFSCITVNPTVGEDLLPLDQQYDIYTAEFYLDEIDMRMADSLSGYSSTKFTLGAIRDEQFGLSTRGTVLSLVPLLDTLDFGSNPQVKQFHFTAEKDTTSFADPSQQNIIQTVKVYELDKAISSDEDFYAGATIAHSSKKITAGAPVYNGADSLSFDFSKEYAKKYLDIKQEDLKDIKTYLKKFPGIYLTTDSPAGNGGRINRFKLGLNYNTQYYYVQGNFAELKFTSTYDGVKKDTSFVFYFSPIQMENVDSLITNHGKFQQYAYNVAHHESKAQAGKAGEIINFEGGVGLKPVIPAKHIREKMHEVIGKYGDPTKAVIAKATIEMPFIAPENLDDLYKYPTVLSPTVRIKSDTSLFYLNLTDTSIEEEDNGEINKSLLKYTPDITHHAQTILGKAADYDKFDNYDVWFLSMAYEVTKTVTEGNKEMSDYYNQLAYASMYGDMYGYGGGYGYGGYGYGGYGYGGYGGYGNMYSNYYTYSMLAQQAAGGQTQTSTDLELDKDRYYNGILVGPKSSSAQRPKMKITFALPKE